MAATPARLVIVLVTGMDEYQSRLVDGIHRVLGEQGVGVLVLITSWNAVLPPSLAHVIAAAEPCGVVATNLEAQEKETSLAEILASLHVPLVYVGQVRPDHTCVRGDSVPGMRTLMAHLLDDRKVRRPVLVRGVPHHRDSIEREKIFREEMARRRLPVDERLVLDGYFWNEIAYGEVRALLDEVDDIDAVIAFNDLSALGALGALDNAGLRVPEDVLLTGFDNEVIASLSWPGITSVDQNLEAQGAIAAEHLLAVMEGEPPMGLIQVPSHVVARRSTGDAPQLAEALRDATAMARGAQRRLASADSIMALNFAMLQSRTVDEVVTTLTESLHRLGLRRFFLVVRDSPLVDGDRLDRGVPLARLALAHRDGEAIPFPDEPYPAHHLLPESLHAELSSGLLSCQALRTGIRELGYMLLERVGGTPSENSMIHNILSRALEAILGGRELEHRARRLEQEVDAHDRDLRAEIAARRRVERDLQAEVALRRRLEQDLRTAAAVRRRTEHELQAEISTRRRAEQDLHRVTSELRQSRTLDPLTRLATRETFARRLGELWDAGSTMRQRLTLLLVALDRVPATRDGNARPDASVTDASVTDASVTDASVAGTLTADDTLVNVARCLERSVRREDDLACRYGDTVFAVLLPTGGVRGAAEVSRLFRRHLADLAVPPGASTDPPGLTASIGIAVRAGHPGLTPASLVTVAEDALHRAEALGGSRTVLAPGSGCPPDCLGVEHRPAPPSVPSEVAGIPHR